jgi:hypothetical protein
MSGYVLTIRTDTDSCSAVYDTFAEEAAAVDGLTVSGASFVDGDGVSWFEFGISRQDNDQ